MIGNSPHVQYECHEPFLNARKEGFDPDEGYKQIYDSIGGKKFERSRKATSVAVKEMSHWIDVNHEYKRLAELTKKPVLVLIRNPLLSVESRIRRVLVTLDMRSSIVLQRQLLDFAATTKGFANWKELSTKPQESEEKNEHLDFLHDYEGLDRLYDIPILTIQNGLLDYVARKGSYQNWRDLLEKKLYIERDYTFFEKILKINPRRMAFEKSEFSALSEQVQYFESSGKPHYIFDTTDLRADPATVLRELCTRMQISYSPEMIEWGKSLLTFTQNKHKSSRECGTTPCMPVQE